MATLKDIEKAVEDTIRYQGARTPIARRAINLVGEILLGVRKSLDCNANDNAVQLILPADERGVAKQLGEYINSYDDGYASGLRFTVGQFSVDVLFYIVTREAAGLPAFEHRVWTLKTEGNAEFDLGLDLNNEMGKVAACEAITEEAKKRLVNQVTESLRPPQPTKPFKPHPVPQVDGGSRWSGSGRGGFG